MKNLVATQSKKRNQKSMFSISLSGANYCPIFNSRNENNECLGMLN